jgi:uncharacterized protein (DUF58 family)
MPATQRFLHPDALKRISRLELRARYVVEGFLSGMHRSPYLGQSIEFAQHREYAHGDDLRRIDWKVWAKHDRYYLKQYEEETNLRCMLLVDVSNSMRYGANPWSKYEYACTLAVSLAYLLLRQQDAVGLMAFDEQVRSTVALSSRRNHLQALIAALAADEPQRKTDLGRILRQAAQAFPRRGIFVLVSDLLVERDGLFKGLKLLRSRGHDVLVFHVLDDDELDFRFSGPTRFEALEGLERLNVNPRALRAGYLEALHAYLDELRRGCARHVVDYKLVRTSEPLDAVLASFLSHRMGSLHRS